MQEQGLSAALAKYSGITDADEVAMIKTFYDLFVEKAPFERFLQALSAMQSTPVH